MKDSLFVTEAITARQNFRMFGCQGQHCNFPVVLERPKDGVKRKTEGTIHGEVFLADRTTIGKLDILERNGMMYTREIQRVHNPDLKKSFEVWMYIGNTNFWYNEMSDLGLVGKEEESNIYYWMEEHERAKIHNI